MAFTDQIRPLGVAYSLWNSYGSMDAVQDTSKRPLGDVRIDGWDIDVEAHPNNEDAAGYLGAMLNKLRSYFEADTANKYYIHGKTITCRRPIG